MVKIKKLGFGSAMSTELLSVTYLCTTVCAEFATGSSTISSNSHTVSSYLLTPLAIKNAAETPPIIIVIIIIINTVLSKLVPNIAVPEPYAPCC